MADYERILLTGGAGFVGSHLSGPLARAYPGAARIMMMRPGEPCRDPAWTPFAAELTDERDVERLVKDTRPDLVVHLAGQASVGLAAQAAEETRRANVFGPRHLAGAVARHAPEAVVLFASSASVYGASLRDGAATEETPLRPIDDYGRSKAEAEALLAELLGPDARLVVARPVNHTGWGQKSRAFSLADFAARIAEIECGRRPPFILHGNLSAERDFLDVRDVAEAYMRLIAIARRLPGRVGVFNVASGEAHSIEWFLDGLLAKTDVKIEKRRDEDRMRASDIPRVACDASRLRRETGWAPRRSIDDMLQSLLDYWRQEVARNPADAAQ